MKTQYQKWYRNGNSFIGINKLTDQEINEVAEYFSRSSENDIAYYICRDCMLLDTKWCPFLGCVDRITNAVVEYGCTKYYD